MNIEISSIHLYGSILFYYFLKTLHQIYVRYLNNKDIERASNILNQNVGAANALSNLENTLSKYKNKKKKGNDPIKNYTG